MMQHQSAPRHKPSLSLSSMELVLSPSYASAANSSITASTASVSATASASTSGGGGGSSSSKKKKNGNGNGAHDEDNANLSFHASPVGSTIPHLLSTDCDNDSDDDDEDYYNNNKGQETYMNQNPRHRTTGGGHYEEGFIASSTRSNSFTHRYGNNSGADREDDDDNDQFQSMLLDQQRQADEPCLDDSVIYHHQNAGTNDADSHYTYPTQTASLPPPSSSSALEDDVESSMSLLQTNEERSHYFQRDHHHHHHRTSAGKNLLSKFSRSADSSREQAWEVVPPITMMIDLDDNDEDLPWMLSQPGFGVVGTTGNHCVGYESDGGREKVEGNESSLLQHDGGPHSPTQQQSLMRTAPTHRRYPSSLSSASSQSSIRSILRNGINNSGSAESRETATTASGISGATASTASIPTPLLPRPNNWCDRADGAPGGIPANSGLDLGRVGMREEAEPLIPVESSIDRGRSVHVQDRLNQRSHRFTSQSARKSNRNDDGRGALSVASARTGRDSHSHHHRRTVSFPAELIANDSKSNNCKTAPRDLPRDGSKSPRSLPPPGSQYDPNLTPLLDMGSSRTRKKLPAHVVQSVSELSPRTADFLAHEPVAVTALCKIQDRERYGHLLGPSTSSGAPITIAAITATIPSSKSNWGCNTYPPPAASSQSPAKRLQASYQRKLWSEAANFDRSSVLDTKQENEGNAYLSPSSKIQVFGFSSANRRGRPSSIKSTRRRKRMSNVGLLSPVEEMGGNTTGSTTTLIATTPMARYSLPPRHNNIGGQPSFASDGSCEIRKETTSVSPLTSELQKAADAVWRDAETSPSSASASASASASSRSSFSIVATQCQCVVS